MVEEYHSYEVEINEDVNGEAHLFGVNYKKAQDKREDESQDEPDYIIWDMELKEKINKIEDENIKISVW